MLGIDRRPFTIPSMGDTILVNLGAGFDDPIHYRGFGDPEKPGTQRSNNNSLDDASGISASLIDNLSVKRLTGELRSDDVVAIMSNGAFGGIHEKLLETLETMTR